MHMVPSISVLVVMGKNPSGSITVDCDERFSVKGIGVEIAMKSHSDTAFLSMDWCSSS